jgi:NAD(P)-dependent dehydrogenase (short-subunit alcohol dehydrogenase family)
VRAVSPRSAFIAGSGGAAGTAICKSLGERGYRIVAAGRNRERLAAEVAGVADEIVEMDFASETSVDAQASVLREAEVLVYNAGRIDLANIADTTSQMFKASWADNVLGAFLCARHAAPAMVSRGRGSMLFMGATVSVRGGARTHAFASAKHALRRLAASLAKELGPSGVHIAHVVIDGKIWGDRTRRRFPDVRESECIDPTALAGAVTWLVEQPRSAWTFELDLRPYGERWS